MSGRKCKSDGESQQDIFSSQSSYMSLDSEQIDITLQLTEFVWVQCDNPDCQKWRRVPADNPSQFEETTWLCHMNTDDRLASCMSPEEDYSRYDSMARKMGIKYVMSQLEVGALVWAKMIGYCRWPGILTPDPDTGVHVHMDIDTDPYSYHVEFLGKPHTHSWVRASAVESYGHKNLHLIQEDKLIQNKAGKKGGKGRSKIFASDMGKIRSTYRNTHVQDIVKEADMLLQLRASDRLRYCQFKYNPSHDAEEKVHSASRTQSNPQKRRKPGRVSSHGHGGKVTPGCREVRDAMLACAVTGASGGTVKRWTGASGGTVKRWTGASGGTVKRWTGASGGTVKRWMGDTTRQARPSVRENGMTGRSQVRYRPGSVDIIEDNMSGSSRQSDVRTLRHGPHDSPDQFSQSQLKFYNTLVDKTKEEKFTIDIDMYHKNEKAFEHDVRRFMWRNGKKIRTTPVWHNVPIKLFQLYLAVHERGGFQQVTERKLWTAVYKELTEAHHVTSGSVAKHYYEKNLYPFELYMSGKDFEAAMTGSRRKNKATVNRVPGNKVATETMVKQTVPDHLSEDLDSYTMDIEALIKHLDGELEDSDGDNMESAVVKAKPVKDIKFHDESTETSGNVYSESVAEFVLPDNEGAASARHIAAGMEMSQDSLDIADVESTILHEMRALEDQMKDISGELDRL